jgi:hypothetical protein
VMQELEKSRLAFRIGKGNIFGHFDQAIEKALQLVENKEVRHE